MHPYPRLFTRANARLQRGLNADERLALTVLTFIVQWLDDDHQYGYWEDVLYLSNYGLITACPN